MVPNEPSTVTWTNPRSNSACSTHAVAGPVLPSRTVTVIGQLTASSAAGRPRCRAGSPWTRRRRRRFRRPLVPWNHIRLSRSMALNEPSTVTFVNPRLNSASSTQRVSSPVVPRSTVVVMVQPTADEVAAAVAGRRWPRCLPVPAAGCGVVVTGAAVVVLGGVVVVGARGRRRDGGRRRGARGRRARPSSSVRTWSSSGSELVDGGVSQIASRSPVVGPTTPSATSPSAVWNAMRAGDAGLVEHVVGGGGELVTQRHEGQLDAQHVGTGRARLHLRRDRAVGRRPDGLGYGRRRRCARRHGRLVVWLLLAVRRDAGNQHDCTECDADHVAPSAHGSSPPVTITAEHGSNSSWATRERRTGPSQPASAGGRRGRGVIRAEVDHQALVVEHDRQHAGGGFQLGRRRPADRRSPRTRWCRAPG